MRVEGLNNTGQPSNQGSSTNNAIGRTNAPLVPIDCIEKIPWLLREKMLTSLFGRVQKLP